MEKVDVKFFTGSLSRDGLVSHVLSFCKDREVSMAAWRVPRSEEIHLILDFNENNVHASTALEDLPAGFMFSPFDKKKDPTFIKNEVYLALGTGEFRGSSEKIDKIQDYILSEPPSSKEPPKESASAVGEKLELPSDQRDHFVDLVTLGIKMIGQGHVQKVVPSRTKEIELPAGFKPGKLFFDLCSTYTNAFVSLVYTPGHGAWMGATPELLIDVSGDTFKTVSLAGTQKYDPERPLSEVAWTQKEIEEQALVSRYIINCFKKIRLREFEEIGPKTVRAGNLIHLKTEYSVDMAATNFPNLGSVMLDLLHPTSAICGMPLQASLDFILEHEHYDREFFSGYLGPVNFNNKTSLFVNLRCMKLHNGTATLYAGAGVTEDSDPAKEWLETEMKMNTLLNIIR